ncbi:alpha/beta fold hydrolase [Catenuloplanes atrovinosus]|uniref:Pimeloyl-ACP methyl ester carboxylesterase n=1 Tax=Catenuloplanes atrovinosus TaxID=137266 RepID=A0AAE3YNV8_9ACTN|nr:alpha/beta hydrolase [Catenuloplanes atrovinosus]MDR7277249.1 pimeloyl-ACP methyl ester carboxylesterase [Catenuloplanes atrovinosus]
MRRTDQGSPRPSGSTVQAGELTVGIIDDGGDGAPLLLVHGDEGDRTQFRTLRELLGGGIRTISYDQRDSGITVNPPVPYTLEVLADDLADLLDALGLDRAHLLGTSFGGAVAQHVALRHPGRVVSLILVATTPSSALGSRVINSLRLMTSDERARATGDFLFTPDGQDSMRAGPVRTLAARDPDQHARRHEAARQHEVRDRLREITAPTLIVHGTADRLAPYAGALLMEERMPYAELRSIENGRHGIAVEFADQVARWVREFIGVDATDAAARP